MAAGENDNHPLSNGTYDWQDDPNGPPLTENDLRLPDFGPDGPQPGTAAYTAWVMHALFPPEENGLPDDYWDDFKEDLKEGRI